MNTAELFKIIESRRAVMPKMYCEEEITEDEINLILASANWAPTHKHTEPGRFIVLTGKAKERFADFMTAQYKKNTAKENQSQRKLESIVEKCEKSNKIILICAQISGNLPEWEEIASVATAVQNMWLMCTSMQIGSYWSTPAAISNMNEFVSFEPGEKCIGIFYMGKINFELYKGQRTPIESKVRFIND